MYYNVLPDEVKKNLRKEYRTRLLTVGLFGLAAVAFVAAAALFPSYIVASSKKDHTLQETAALQKLKQETNTPETLKELSVTKTKIQALESGEVAHEPSELLSKIAKARPDGVMVSGILYQPQGDGSHNVILSGTADTRENLLAFKDALEHTEPFLKADVPVAQLAKSVNVSFNITLTGSF